MNKDDFAYTPDDVPSHWKLNISDRDHVIAAKAALGKGFRGRKVRIPSEDRMTVIRKVNAACRKFKLEPIPIEHSALYLQHYGVKGMKWGIRKKRTKSSDYTEAKKLSKKKRSELSNQDLRKLNERMRLEDEYNRLKNNRSAINRGHQIAQKVVTYGGTAMALYGLGKKALDTETGQKVVNAGKHYIVSAYAANELYKFAKQRNG